MFQAHSETSKEAFRTMDQKETKADKVYACIAERGRAGLSAGWIAKFLNMQTGSVAARLVELERDGRIKKLRKTMENPSGKKGNIYICSGWSYNFSADDFIAPKPEKKSSSTVEDMRACLEDIERRIALGEQIKWGDEVHNKIRRLIGRV